ILLRTFPRPLSYTLFPYTTLFRSCTGDQRSLPRCRARTLGEEFLAASWLRIAPRWTSHICRIQPRPCVRTGLAIRNVLSLAHRRSEEHTSELQSRFDLVCRLLLEK